LKFEIGKIVSKMAKCSEVEAELLHYENMNMNSFMDVRGIPVN